MPKLLAGLGNPGELYTKNRHNVGFLFLDYLKQSNQIPFLESDTSDKYFELNNQFSAEILRVNNKIVVLKPQTFMNRSGISIRKVCVFYKIHPSDVIIAHDDLDIPLGQVKVQFGKGPKIHNGISSIEDAIGTSQFWRVRIGIENRDPDNHINGHSYVLSNFTTDQRTILSTVFDRAAEKLLKQVTSYSPLKTK